MFEFSDIFEAELTTRVFIILSILCASVMAALAVIVSDRAAARPLRQLRGPASRASAAVGILALLLLGLSYGKWSGASAATAMNSFQHQQAIDLRMLQQQSLSDLL